MASITVHYNTDTACRTGKRFSTMKRLWNFIFKAYESPNNLMGLRMKDTSLQKPAKVGFEYWLKFQILWYILADFVVCSDDIYLSGVWQTWTVLASVDGILSALVSFLEDTSTFREICSIHIVKGSLRPQETHATPGNRGENSARQIFRYEKKENENDLYSASKLLKY
jgi:hypothetical protein